MGFVVTFLYTYIIYFDHIHLPIICMLTRYMNWLQESLLFSKLYLNLVFPYIFSRVKSWASSDLQRSLWQSVVLAPGSTFCAFSLQCFAAGVWTSLIDTVGEAFSLPTKGWYQFRNILGHFFFHILSSLVLPIKLPRFFVNYHYISWTLC